MIALKKMIRLVCLALACASVTGCITSNPRWVAAVRSPYQPDNIFLRSAILPPDLQRVAVLPVIADRNQGALISARERFEPVLISELIKTKRFEVVRISPETLRARTGRSGWDASEILPADFLSGLEKSSGCDAVLFSQITVFRAYPPMAIGWRMRLVDVRNGTTLWSSDEVFDAGDPAVISGALHYAHHEMAGESEWVTLHSPGSFGQYAVAQLLDTLPKR